MEITGELEQTLDGTSANLDQLTKKIQDFYYQRAIESPGINAENLAQIFISA